MVRTLSPSPISRAILISSSLFEKALQACWLSVASVASDKRNASRKWLANRLLTPVTTPYMHRDIKSNRKFVSCDNLKLVETFDEMESLWVGASFKAKSFDLLLSCKLAEVEHKIGQCQVVTSRMQQTLSCTLLFFLVDSDFPGLS